FLLSGARHTRTLHSFPTRRSSDLRSPPNDRRGWWPSSVLCGRYGARPRAPERPSRADCLFAADARAEGSLDWASLQAIPLLERRDRKSTRLNSSHVSISYAVFCLK